MVKACVKFADSHNIMYYTKKSVTMYITISLMMTLPGNAIVYAYKGIVSENFTCTS